MFFYPPLTYLISRVFHFRIVILLVLIVFTADAQNEVKQKHQSNLDDWRNGSVLINDGAVIEGQVRYNWLENIVTIKTEQDTRTFNAQGIQRFDMEGVSGMRHFISSPKELTTDAKATCYFFEILLECKHFALMMERNAFAVGNTDTKTREVMVEKFLYLFDEDGNINLYMTVKETEVMGFAGFYSGKKPTSRVVDKNLMSRYLGNRFHEVKEYAKRNNLSFWDRNDLISILSFYKELEAEEK